MYLISSRKNFTNGKVFGQKDSIRLFEGINKCVQLSKDALLSKVSDQKVVVVIHGFNNPFEDMVEEYLRLEARWSDILEQEYDYVLGYTWPAGDSEFDYFRARKNTDRAARRLRKWLIALTAVNSTIDIVGHSLAAMVGFKTLREKAPVEVRNIFSFGAAISKNILFKKEIPPQILEKVEALYAFHNRNDSILKYWFRFIEGDQALGCTGLNKEELLKPYDKIHLIDCSGVIDSHVDYTRSLMVVRFMDRVLEGENIDQFIRLSEYGSRLLEKSSKPLAKVY